MLELTYIWSNINVIDATGIILSMVFKQLQHSVWSDHRTMKRNNDMVSTSVLLVQTFDVERLSHSRPIRRNKSDTRPENCSVELYTEDTSCYTLTLQNPH